MQNRSPIVVVLLTFLTLGIYSLVWQVKTKNEMNRAFNAGIPTAWLILVPFIGALLWQWKWSAGAEKATGMSGALVFILMLFVPIVGIPVMVSKFNEAKPAVSPSLPVAQLRAA